MDSIEIEAKTLSEAIQKALDKLQASREDVDIQVLSEEKMGLFGMAGGKHAKIRVTLKKKKS